MSETLNERLTQLIVSLDLQEIVPVELYSARLGEGIAHNEELEMNITLAFADGDPVKNENRIVFRPKYEILVQKKSVGIFKHITKFLIVFEIKAISEWERLWPDTELQEIFKSRQINKLLWPLFRQQVIDGMTRVGLQPITLKWIM